LSVFVILDWDFSCFNIKFRHKFWDEASVNFIPKKTIALNIAKGIVFDISQILFGNNTRKYSFVSFDFLLLLFFELLYNFELNNQKITFSC
jgi:hypothetical protein